MSGSSTEDFFAALDDHEHFPRLSRCAGAVRFDILGPEGVDHTWRVEIDKGNVSVSEDDAPADAVVRADRVVMDGIVNGEVNAVAATLRGVVAIEGNWDLILMCQRMFADPAFAALRPEVLA